MKYPEAKSHIYNIEAYKAGKTSRNANIVPIKLSSNENPNGASPKAMQAYNEAASSINRYPDGSCLELRHAIADIHWINHENIICGAGSDELIGLLINAYAGAGDEVIFTEHAFLMYKIYTMIAGATPAKVKEKGLRADIDALVSAVTERTKIVFLANPNNPTGSYLNELELKELRRRLPPHILLAIDAAYAECATAADYSSGLNLAKETQNTVMLRTFSKIYGLPSLRLGWMYGADHIIDAISRIKSPFNVTGIAQKVGIAAVNDLKWTEAQKKYNAQVRKYLKGEIESLGLHVYPSEGNFLLVDFKSEDNAKRILSGLEERHIYVRGVSSYKLPTCLRISMGAEAENKSFLTALKEL